MSRYRKVETRTTTDARYRRLSPSHPCGQHLWLYLLSCPFTEAIPGIMTVGEAGMAEALGWPLKGFREAFREVFREGMAKADWEARLVWLPKALKHNAPASPNVVRNWGSRWHEVPECPLKVEVWHELKAFMEGLGEGFGKAFQEAFPIDFAESVSVSVSVSEAVEKIKSARVRSRNGTIPEPIRLEFESRFWPAYPKKVGKLEALKQYNLHRPPIEKVLTALAWQTKTDRWMDEDGKFIPDPERYIKKGRWEDEPTKLVKTTTRQACKRCKHDRSQHEAGNEAWCLTPLCKCEGFKP